MPDHDLQSVAFPTLGDDPLADFGQCKLTTRRRFRDGDALFRAGDRDGKFFVVVSGHVEIVDETGDAPKTITVHGPGRSPGTCPRSPAGRPSSAATPAAAPRCTRSPREALRQVLNDHPDLGDVILPAFIARRQLLRESGTFTGLRVVGPPLVGGHLPGPRLPGQEQRACSPGSTPRPTRRWPTCSASSG